MGYRGIYPRLHSKEIIYLKIIMSAMMMTRMVMISALTIPNEDHDSLGSNDNNNNNKDDDDDDDDDNHNEP